MKRGGFKRPVYERPPTNVAAVMASRSQEVHAMDDVASFPPISRAAVDRVMRPAPKTKRDPSDPAYVAYVRTCRCVGCGKPGPNHAHHQHGEPGTRKGMNVKASDKTCVPLCETKGTRLGCHDRWHRTHEIAPGIGRDRSITKMDTARARLRRAWKAILREKERSR